MMKVVRHIYPVFDQLVSRQSKEWLLQQRAKVIWFTGLSGSGKTTIARDAEKVLYEMGHMTMLLDGDNVRAGINNNLGFSAEDRHENIRRIAEAAKLFLDCGIITLCCFVSPTEELRELAAKIIGPVDFIEVYVNTSLEECEKRDVKGLYAKARNGEIPDFTGISAPFEAPASPALVLNTEGRSEEDTVKDLLKFLVPLLQHEGTI
jgi:adenylylsulfate kinase